MNKKIMLPSTFSPDLFKKKFKRNPNIQNEKFLLEEELSFSDIADCVIIVPENFNGEKFAVKFNLSPFDFSVVGDGYLDCPKLPNIKFKDIEDCVN